MKEKERSGHKKGPMTRWEEQGLKEGRRGEQGKLSRHSFSGHFFLHSMLCTSRNKTLKLRRRKNFG